MRKFILAFLLVITFALPAHSGTITYEKDFKDISFFEADFTIFFDGPWNMLGEEVFSTTFFTDPNVNITEASLSITHLGNRQTCCQDENWYLATENDEYTWDLSTSFFEDGWITDTWILAESLAKNINELNFLKLFIKESTNRYDGIFVDNIELVTFHDTKPVPEPATLFLLGTGLLSLVGIKRRKA